jgi:phosphoserine phosphatase
VGLRLAALDREAAAQRWSWADLVRARLRELRPRRAEVNELGAAYLATLSPGAADAASALRRAGITVTLASDVAAEALFGVATALGVSPNELYAPRLRFDAIGAYLGCDLNAARPDDEASLAPHRLGASAGRTLFVGTRRSAAFAPRSTDDFVAFAGVVAREGTSETLATIGSFHDLAPFVLR